MKEIIYGAVEGSLGSRWDGFLTLGSWLLHYTPLNPPPVSAPKIVHSSVPKLSTDVGLSEVGKGCPPDRHDMTEVLYECGTVRVGYDTMFIMKSQGYRIGVLVVVDNSPYQYMKVLALATPTF